jgi:hypothetical protein
MECMQSVQIVEVAPRDGLQNETAILATAVKAELAGCCPGARSPGSAWC